MDMTARVRSALDGWFTIMAAKYCGRDYGSEKLNRYHFLRRMYGMTASQAWAQCQVEIGL